GSINSQDTVASTVLRLVAAILGQSGCRYSMLDALELFNSAPRTRKGLPSTISCVADPCFSRCGMEGDGFTCENAAPHASEIRVVVITRIPGFISCSSGYCSVPIPLGLHLDAPTSAILAPRTVSRSAARSRLAGI